MFKRFNFCHSGAEPFSPTRNFARNQRAIPGRDWLGAGSPGAGIAQSHIEHEMDIPSNLAVTRDEIVILCDIRRENIAASYRDSYDPFRG
jgi:hypothetical protein